MATNLSRWIAKYQRYDPNIRLYVSNTGLVTTFNGNTERAADYAFEGLTYLPTDPGRERALKPQIGKLIQEKNPGFIIALVWGNEGIPSTDLILPKGTRELWAGNQWRSGNPEYFIFTMSGPRYRIRPGPLCGNGAILLAGEEKLRRRTSGLYGFMRQQLDLTNL